MSKLLNPPLSYSSASLLATCEQKFYYYKANVKYDPDVEASDSLVIGSAFHWILEETLHTKPESFKPLLDYCCEEGFLNKSTGKHETLSVDDRCLVHAMVLKYLRLHAKRQVDIVAVEESINTDKVIGYIDAVAKEKGSEIWYIVDLKTAAGFYESKMAALPRDPQLNLYAAHSTYLAKKLKLDPTQFAGCLYSVTTKSRAKRAKDDTDKTYTARLLNQYVKSYDIFVPVSAMDTEERLSAHLLSYEAAGELLAKKKAPVRNYGNCLNWNRPCEYWSQCYGKTHSALMSELEIIKEE